MADFPCTDNTTVAALAAALELSKQISQEREPNFDVRLERFLKAYKAIIEAVEKGPEKPASSS